MKTVTTLSMAVITALFIGCGSGSSSSGTPTSSTPSASTSSDSNIRGYLVDAPVEGVFYSCGGPNSRGFTDSTGLFVCESSPIEFYIGKLSLGIVNIPTTDGNVYPQDLVGAERTDFANENVIKMAQLLQSLDDDTNPSNGINITPAIMDQFPTGMQFSTKSLNELLALAGVSEIEASSAVQHLQDTMGYASSMSSSSSSVSSTQSSSVSSSGTISDGTNTLTIKSSDDVKGYTIRSNRSTIGTTNTHQTVVVSFKCDGSFDYSLTSEAFGHSDVEVAQGSYVSVDTDSTPHELHWGGTYTQSNTHDIGESMNDYLELNADDKLIGGETCWYSYGTGTGESCPNNLYIESITRDSVCN